MKNKCDCFGCRANKGIKKFGSIAKYYNSLKSNEKQEYNREFIKNIISVKEESEIIQIFIEVSRLNILSIEKFQKTLGLLDEEETNALADLLFLPYINKKIKSDPIEHWKSEMDRIREKELETKLEELAEAFKRFGL